MWASASSTVHGSRVGGRGTRRFQSPGRSRATRRSSAANSRRVRSTTFLRMCRMAAGSLVERQHRAGNLPRLHRDRKSTRLNSSHSQISYAVFCLKKKKKKKKLTKTQNYNNTNVDSYHLYK